ncbi:MAG: GNAT family N-acetyltransferase [Candidatus Woesearchaeota archaeon]|jgi:ribosomal protein S18 acetylase RimI-like enzyme
MIFREATERDYPAIIEFHKSENWGLDTLSAIKNFHKLNTIIICEDEGKIIGKMDLMQKSKQTRSFLYLERLIIHHEFRHKGVATKFMEYAENECRKRHLEFLELSVRDDNVPAKQLYSSNGFQVLGKKIYMQKKM